MKNAAQTLRGLIRLSLFTLHTLGLLLLWISARLVRSPAQIAIVRLWHQGVCWILSIRVDHSGPPIGDGASYVVANHLSYLDIPVLGSLSDCRFVAKSEVANWPVLGWLARLAGTEFIERNPRMADIQREQVLRSPDKGQPVLFFPEGTSSDGRAVLPFKSTLFQAIIDRATHQHTSVQGVAITFLDKETGCPLDEDQVQAFAWFGSDNGEDKLAAHLWNVFCEKGLTVKVSSLHPMAAKAGTCRKLMSNIMQQQISHTQRIILDHARINRAITDG